MPNIEVLNFIKQTLLDLTAQKDTRKMKMGEFNSPLSTVDSSNIQKKSTKKPQN
jgi:hypothetical protein